MGDVMSLDAIGQRRIAPATPAVLGELLTADEIAARYFKGKPSRRWVASKMPRDKAVRLGNAFHWYEVDVVPAVAALRGAA